MREISWSLDDIRFIQEGETHIKCDYRKMWPKPDLYTFVADISLET